MKKIILIITITLVALIIGYHYTFADVYGSSLVGWWRMDSNDISGTSITDRSGNGGTATIIGGALNVTGKMGQAMSFNGSSQYLTVNNNSVFDIGAGGSTYCAWFKGPATVGGVRLIEKFSLSVEDKELVLRITGGKSVLSGFLFNVMPGATFLDGTTDLAATSNKWHHGCFTYNGSNTMIIYVDGKQDAVSTGLSGAVANNTGAIGIGSRNTGQLNTMFTGSIDEVRIYNRQLSSIEILQLYYLGFPKHNSII